MAEVTSAPWGPRRGPADSWASLPLSQEDFAPAPQGKRSQGPPCAQGGGSPRPSCLGSLLPWSPCPLSPGRGPACLRIPSPLPSPGPWGKDSRVQTALASSPRPDFLLHRPSVSGPSAEESSAHSFSRVHRDLDPVPGTVLHSGDPWRTKQGCYQTLPHRSRARPAGQTPLLFPPRQAYPHQPALLQ